MDLTSAFSHHTCESIIMIPYKIDTGRRDSAHTNFLPIPPSPLHRASKSPTQIRDWYNDHPGRGAVFLVLHLPDLAAEYLGLLVLDRKGKALPTLNLDHGVDVDPVV